MRIYKLLGIIFAFAGIAMTVANFIDWPRLGFFALIAPPFAIAGFACSAVGGRKAQAEGERLGLAVVGLVLGFLATIVSAAICFTLGMIYLFIV